MASFKFCWLVAWVLMSTAVNSVMAEDVSTEASAVSLGDATIVSDDEGETDSRTEVQSINETIRKENSDSGKSDNDRARDAGHNGTVLPYGRVLKKVKQAIAGDVVKVRLLQHDASLWTYEVTVLDELGHYTRLSLNARTGVILSKKRR